MTKSRRRPDPPTSPSQGGEIEKVLGRLSGSAAEKLPDILREIDEAAALLAEVLDTPEPCRSTSPSSTCSGG